MSRVLNLMMWQLFKKLQHNLSYSLYFIVYWLTRATRSHATHEDEAPIVAHLLSSWAHQIHTQPSTDDGH